MKHYKIKNAAVRVVGTAAAFEYFEPMFVARTKELLVAALCDGQLNLQGLLSFPGTETAVRVPTQAIIRDAVLVGCSGVILAHNHPSGDVRPSPSDVSFTRNLIVGLEAAGITLLDHLIFDHEPWFSFRQASLI